jgi:phenylalanine-4-hydroxylase
MNKKALNLPDAAFATHEFRDGYVPRGLRKYLVDQHYTSYEASAHDVWRKVLARNERLISEYREWMHPAYVEGMQALALPRRIPRTEELNERLEPTGWKVVSVDGYIPSEAYVALMSCGIFPVSRDVRRFEHIDFAPAPDMVHDVLGHLPMLFSEEYREFLRRLATVMTRAVSNSLDADYYEALRLVTSLRSEPSSAPDDVSAAEARLSEVYRALQQDASELTRLRRMYIWSIEFGLLGTPEAYSIHGSALLSSPTEFRAACEGAASIVPYSLAVVDCENAVSDLLAQYFVATDFAHLRQVLASYEKGMTRPTTDPPLSGEREIGSRLAKEWRRDA